MSDNVLNFGHLCKKHDCPNYIEWDYEFEHGSQPYPCQSCTIVGQSYVVDVIPGTCLFLQELISSNIRS